MIRGLGIAALLLFSLPLLGQEAIVPQKFQAELLAQAIFEATNQLRLREGLEAFKANEALQNAARYQAERMAKRRRLQHKWPGDKKYGSPRQRIQAFEGNYNRTGENIAQDYLLDIPSGKAYFINSKGQATQQGGTPIPYRSYQQLAQKVVKDWYLSPGHRANLLGDFEFIGIAASFLVPEKKGPNFDVYLVQNFGK